MNTHLFKVLSDGFKKNRLWNNLYTVLVKINKNV